MSANRDFENRDYGERTWPLTESVVRERRAMEGGTLIRRGVGIGILLAGTAFAEAAHAGDPTTADCLSASDAALTQKNEHHLRAARSQLLVCAADSCPADVRTECARKVEELNAAIPTIVFEAKDGAGADLSAVSVTVDGVEAATHLEGTALSFDPGDHVFVFRTTGQPDITKHIVVRQGEKDRRERIVFGVVATPASAASTAPAGVAEHRTLGTRRTAAIVLAAVGIVGVGFGTGFGIDAMSKHDAAARVCPNVCADASGVQQWHDASSAGTISTIGFVAGGVLLAGGAALWLTGKDETTRVGLGLGTIQWRGTF